MSIVRSVGQAIFKSLVKYDLPATEMIDIVREMGYTYRRSDMLKDIREYLGRFVHEAQISDLGSNVVVPEGWMNKVEMNYPYKYKVWADVQYYDPETGEYITNTRSVYTDDLMKISDYEGYIEGVELAGQYQPDMELTDVTFRGMDVNTAVE